MIRASNFLVNISQNVRCTRQFSCTAIRALDQKWREQKGLPGNPNAFGPLTNLPDYSFLDGRATPLGSNQKRRLKKQQEIAAKIVTLSGELDFAKKRYARIQTEEAAAKENVIKNKLKPKGHLLLKKE
ncbi:39S ribosomal protein L52, mitochondrial [Bactrocera neohumeralis]|uniref:39S ribosomal protein L52, mitochondrial n=1 Tax=Bactrocera tryoni TaxID=59916 RepID=UPI001A960F8A|nr:39S ribosomal protein L52, mitochondrial [Bactrocera tryoni]XP_050323798.1 39S ribosomal protein L52, mitochondrial [Bactrocera neohumeralis]